MGNIVLIGAGGSGISSIGFILKDLGYKNIVGIDSNKGQILEELGKSGINIIIGHGNYKIQKNDIIIYSDGAINTIEVKNAFQNKNKLNLNIYSYFEFIGKITEHFKTISITGTHGKSTTTGMCIYLFNKLIKNFGIGITGALVQEFDNKNYLINNKKINQIKISFDNILKNKSQSKKNNLYFIIEADEFNDHFLYLNTDIGLITNMEFDHRDFFQDTNHYFKSFEKFIKKTNKYILSLQKNENMKNFENKYPNKIIQTQTKNIDFEYIIGEHNKENFSLVYKLLRKIAKNTRKEDIINIVKKFKGIGRRGEFLYKNKHNSLIFTDYGHHPTEIHSVRKAFQKAYPNKDIITIFQPHKGIRLIEFWNEFEKEIKKFDQNYIYEIYSARENINKLKNKFNNMNDIESFETLGKKLANTTKGNYVNNINEVINIIKNEKNKIILIFTAGDLDFKVRKLL